MKYRGNQTDMWDAWFINAEGRIHAFHLQRPRSDTSLPPEVSQAVGHIYSDDLIHWTANPSILPPLFDKDERDYHQKYTGCADFIDGKYIVYYTMRDKEKGNQRIAAAISEELTEFSIYENNPVLVPDERLLIGYGNIAEYDWNIVDCRDLITVKCREDGLYYGYFAAAADVGRGHPVGVIAVAVSDDLLHWRHQSIVYVPKQNGVVEVPDVYEINGKWYLTVLSGGGYVGRASGNDPYAVCCTTYAVADEPRGPFLEREDNVLIAGNAASGYTCRTVVKDDKRYVLYVDRSFGGATLSLPKEIRVNEKGELGAYYADILHAIRLQTLVSPVNVPPIDACEMVQNSFAWRTFGGEWTLRGGAYHCRTCEHDYQAIDLKQSAPSIEAQAAFTIKGYAAGFYVHTFGENRSRRYIFSIEPHNSRMLLASLYGFDFINARAYPFEENVPYSVKLLLLEGQCEVYVDGKLLMQCGLELHETTSVGFFCERGEVTVDNVNVYELEAHRWADS